MRVKPLTDKREIAIAVQKLKGRLTTGMASFRRTIGFPGGQVKGATVFWRPADEIWVHFDANSGENRYWCCYGSQNPSVPGPLHIAVEINPPHRGFNRRMAGTFVREAGGRVFLAHSGRVGGGKKGIGKEAFLDFHPGPNWATVAWPDGRESQTILIGGLLDRHLPEQIATFVQHVVNFKTAVRRDALPKKVNSSGTGFIPEFEGPRKSFRLSTTIEASCDHGTIVRWLKQGLEARGFAVFNDRQRDLFVPVSDQQMRALFEIKTSLAPQDIYGGVGQLMVHAAAQKKSAHCVLVLPRGVTKRVRDLLAKLDIDVIEYSWDHKRPRFGKFPRIKSA
jgi:hypothetical protein